MGMIDDTFSTPNGWRKVTFEDIAESFKRGPFGSAIKKAFFVENGYKVYEQKNAIYGDYRLGEYYISEEKFHELIKFEIKPKDFIVSCSGTIGRIYQIPESAPKGVINQALLRIRLKDTIISPPYFKYLFASAFFQKKVLIETRGSAMLNIAGVKDLKAIEVLLPPLPEQHRIVAKIEELFSELDNGIANLKKAKAQLKVYHQSVLKWAFEGRLMNTEVKDGELPMGWEWITLGEASIKIGDVNHKMPKSIDSGYPYLMTKNLTRDLKLSFENVKYISKEDYTILSRKIKPERGDIIFPRYGTIGRNVLVDTDLPFLISYSCAIIKPDHSKVLGKYIYHYTLSPLVTKEIGKYVVETTQANIGIASLKKFIFPLAPIAKQSQIVQEIESRLSVADKLEETIEQSLKQSEALRQSILKRAFEGKLVPQEETDR